ncbi:hypothetical protein D9M68_1000780 [compost metagenome]
MLDERPWMRVNCADDGPTPWAPHIRHLEHGTRADGVVAGAIQLLRHDDRRRACVPLVVRWTEPQATCLAAPRAAKRRGGERKRRSGDH